MTRVLLTGASRGIGRATAGALARRKVDLVLLGRASEALESTAALVAGLGAKADRVDADLRDPASIDAACRVVLEQFGAPAAIINNAGVIHRQIVERTALGDWEDQLGVNLRAPFLIVRALLPAMRAAKVGRIVNVGSIAGTLGTPRAAAYCASKWGLIGFTKALAEELSGSGLMTLVVLPGSVDTEMLEGSGFEPRMTPEDVAASLVHYALDAPLAHNGATIEMFGT